MKSKKFKFAVNRKDGKAVSVVEHSKAIFDLANHAAHGLEILHSEIGASLSREDHYILELIEESIECIISHSGDLNIKIKSFKKKNRSVSDVSPAIDGQ